MSISGQLPLFIEYSSHLEWLHHSVALTRCHYWHRQPGSNPYSRKHKRLPGSASSRLTTGKNRGNMWQTWSWDTRNLVDPWTQRNQGKWKSRWRSKESSARRHKPRLPPGCRGEIKTSWSAARQHFTRQIKSKAAKQFAKLPRFPWLHEINPSSPSPKFHKDSECLPCEQASMLIQLRTGHILLRKHLNRIRKANSPMCQTCSSQSLTVHHFLMTFPAYTDARKHLETSIGRAARSMKILLTNLKIFPHLFWYISATCQFNH